MSTSYDKWDMVTVDTVCKDALDPETRSTALEELRGFISWIKEDGRESAYPVQYLETTIRWLHAYKPDNKSEDQRIIDYSCYIYNVRRRQENVLCPAWILVSLCIAVFIPFMALAAK